MNKLLFAFGISAKLISRVDGFHLTYLNSHLTSFTVVANALSLLNV